MKRATILLVGVTLLLASAAVQAQGWLLQYNSPSDFDVNNKSNLASFYQGYGLDAFDEFNWTGTQDMDQAIQDIMTAGNYDQFEQAFVDAGYTHDEMESLTDPMQDGDIQSVREALKDIYRESLAFQQSANNPASAQSRMTDNMVQSAVFEKAEPAAPMVEQVRAIAGADAFADFWEYDDGREGTTYGLNPSVTFGEKTQFTATMPIYVEDPDTGDNNYTLGLDGRVKHYVNQNFAIGGHVNYMNQHRENFLDFNEDRETITAGPFVSFNIPMSEKVNLSLGGLVDYTTDLEDDIGDDESWLGAAGANLGIKLTEQIAFNPYAVYYADLESDSPVDDDYVDVGVELAANLSETWSVTAGAKTTLEYENYESYEVYLGSAWEF